MNKYTHIVFSCILILVLGGCNKEKEYNSNLVDVDYFSIQHPSDTTITVFQLDTIHINPEILGLKTDRTYSYEWTLFSGDQDAIVISSERNINEPIAAKPGEYYLTYSVIDDLTKVKSTKLYNVIVNGAFYEGWLVANNVGNQGRLSFIRMDEEVFLNPLVDINHTAYPGRAVAGLSAVYNGYGNLEQIQYYSEHGMTLFDPNTFTQISETNELFFEPQTFEKRPFYDMHSFMSDQYLVSDGKVQVAMGAGLLADEEMGTFSPRIEGDYDFFSYGFRSTMSIFFYDNKNKRFVSLGYGARELSYPTTIVHTASQLRISAIGKTMLAADYSVGNAYMTLMKDDDGYYMFWIPNGFTSLVIGKLETVPDIDFIKGFTASGGLQHAYYTAKNKIYKVDATSNTVTLFYEFPDDVTVADIKMYKRTNRYFNYYLPQPDHNKILVVASNKGGQGEVRYLYLNSSGALDSGRPIKTFTGFGEIVSLDHRNPI